MRFGGGAGGGVEEEGSSTVACLGVSQPTISSLSGCRAEFLGGLTYQVLDSRISPAASIPHSADGATGYSPRGRADVRGVEVTGLLKLCSPSFCPYLQVRTVPARRYRGSKQTQLAAPHSIVRCTTFRHRANTPVLPPPPLPSLWTASFHGADDLSWAPRNVPQGGKTSSGDIAAQTPWRCAAAAAAAAAATPLSRRAGGTGGERAEGRGRWRSMTVT